MNPSKSEDVAAIPGAIAHTIITAKVNFEYFISKKTSISSDEGSKHGIHPIIRLAVISITLGLATMILSVSIVTGFQNEIKSKVLGFASHVQITSLNLNLGLENNPISIEQDFYPNLKDDPAIRNIQVFAHKPGIIKTKKLVEGVIVKGISTDFDWTSFKKWMIEGDTITFLPDKKSNDIVLSKTLADKLNLSLGDKFRMYFIQKPIRQRQFKIAGIYSSGLDLFDKNFIIGDLRHIQKISDWDSTEIGGFDVQLEKFEDLEKIDDLLYGKIDYDLNTTKITDKHREIFGWLDLLDMNVYVVLLFAILVAAINMITALLIIIIEKTNMIGILKALGATNNSIQKIFLYKAANLISKGLLWGNLIGIGLAFIQWKFQLIKLQVETYYISYVPINLDFKHIILLNLGTFVICLLMLILPSMLITSISPVKAIRFK